MTTQEWIEQERIANEALEQFLSEPAPDFRRESMALLKTCDSVERVQMVCMMLAAALMKLRTEKNHGKLQLKGNMENDNPFMPWNMELGQSDPFRPWNNDEYKDDPFAPWNNPVGDERDYQRWCEEHQIPERDR